MSTPHSESIRPFVPTDTVVDDGRVLRRPVTEWTCQLVSVMEACGRKTPDLATIGQACGALNNAALLFAHTGQAEVAESICHSQLVWLDALSDVVSRAELSVLAIHPWVNLGRLYRRSGEFGRALSYFSALRPVLQGRRVRLGEFEAVSCDAFLKAAEPVYVYETMRTYWQSGDLDLVLRFANQLTHPLQTSTVMLKTELELQLWLRDAEPSRALRLLEEMPWPQDRFGVMARCFYTAILLHAMDRWEACEDLLAWQRPHIVSLLRRGDVTGRDLRFAIEVCRLGLHLKQYELFADVLAAGCCAVLRVSDVPFASQLLLLAGRHDSSAAIQELPLVEQFMMDSGYRASSDQPTGRQTADSLARLTDAISQLLCCHASELCV